MTVGVSVAMTATIPAPGNAPTNTLRTRSVSPTGGATQTLSYGTSEGEVDVFCDGEFFLLPSASLTLNLYDGGVTDTDLLDSFRGAANLARVKNITLAIVSGGDENGVTVGGAASNAFAGFWSGTFNLYPDGPATPFGSPAGAVVDGSNKNLKILNNSSTESVVVQVFVSGTSVVPGMWTGFWGFLTYS